uniref:Si:dkeyp-97a10.3 n=1 Tax=Oryzias latipes TaxID=8090 RepID=A0A3P9MHW4_ORYLA
MKQPLLHVCFLLAVFLSASVLAQNPVQIQFQTDPVLTQTGTDSLFTVVTTTSIFSMTWKYNGLDTLGSWSGGTSNINPVTQFLGRVTITSNQLRIGSTQLRDAGNYSVEVTPVGTTGQTSNSRSVQLRVFEAVAGVTLSISSVTVEGGNVTLTCAWTAGTEISVQWAKGGLTITADSRITISGGSLVINPVNRDDAGEYKCTASNPVSAQTATRSLTVYYGPDTPVLTKDTSKNCVGGGDVLVGKAVRLTCTSVSLPPAIFSWEFNGNPISGQPDGGVLTIQTYSTNESGKYACTAKNSITGGTSKQTTTLAVVDVCLDGGEVAGIVIGSFLLLVIIVLLIVLLICLVRRKRVQQRQRDNIFIPKTETNQRPNPPATQPNARGDLEPGPDPPIYPGNGQTRRSVPVNTIQPTSPQRKTEALRDVNRLRSSNVLQQQLQTNKAADRSYPKFHQAGLTAELCFHKSCHAMCVSRNDAFFLKKINMSPMEMIEFKILKNFHF